jgi:hypothetical protein
VSSANNEANALVENDWEATSRGRTALQCATALRDRRSHNDHVNGTKVTTNPAAQHLPNALQSKSFQARCSPIQTANPTRAAIIAIAKGNNEMATIERLTGRDRLRSVALLQIMRANNAAKKTAGPKIQPSELKRNSASFIACHRLFLIFEVSWVAIQRIDHFSASQLTVFSRVHEKYQRHHPSR